MTPEETREFLRSLDEDRTTWAKTVDFEEESGCWRCTTHSGNGEGYIQISIKGNQHKVHRLLLEEKLGRPIRNNKETLHTCHNKWCINPNHLEEGSHSKNITQSHSHRGVYNNPPKGSAHTNAKLTNSEVREIKEKYNRTYTGGPTQRELVEEYEVSQSVISKIMTNDKYSE